MRSMHYKDKYLATGKLGDNGAYELAVSAVGSVFVFKPSVNQSFMCVTRFHIVCIQPGRRD